LLHRHLIQSNQQKHKDNIQKHFYQQQKKDTKYTTPSLMTPYIHLSTEECNPDKDIQTTSPTIQIREDTANIYDAKGKHNGQVSRDRLEWLWRQYENFKQNPKTMNPPIQDFP
jgi:hypothetical protein